MRLLKKSFNFYFYEKQHGTFALDVFGAKIIEIKKYEKVCHTFVVETFCNVSITII